MPVFPITRKAKDKQGLQSIQKSGGSYTIKSRNKVENPNNPVTTLSRGSRVTVTNKQEKIQHPSTVIPGTEETRMVSKTTEHFTPGDHNPNKVNNRSTTPELGKSLKEHPGKTHARIHVQTNVSAGKKPEEVGARRIGDVVAYDHGKHKNEYAGKYEKKTTTVPETVKTPDRVVPGRVEMISKKKIDVTAPKDNDGQRGGLSLKIRRVAGVNNQGKGQNYKRLDVVAGKKTIPVVKFRTKTRGTR